MATALTLSAADALVPQQHHNITNDSIWNKQKEKVKEADGASYYSSPESSPVREKLSIPSAQIDRAVSSKPAITTLPSAPITKPSHPLREATTITNDPLEFLAVYMESQKVRPAYVPESEIEKQILQAQSRKTEELLEKRRRDRELALALEARVMEKESLLVQLQADMKRKVKHIETKKDDLEQFRIDFAEQVKQSVPSSSTVQKSSRNRMEEEREKKKLLADWKRNHSEDTLSQLRKSILSSQDEVTDLNLRIINLKNELNLLHKLAVSSKSSVFIMADLREQRHQNSMMGIERPALAAEEKPQGPPPTPIPRYHFVRMQEEKDRKAAERAARRNPNYASSSSSSHGISSSPPSFASSSSSKSAVYAN